MSCADELRRHRPVRLETPDQVHSLLARASNLRSVAATNMNERSSRSHSVFSLRVKGDNPLTGENCEVSRYVCPCIRFAADLDRRES